MALFIGSHNVDLFAGRPVTMSITLSELTITPSTISQSFSPSIDIDGWDLVSVAAIPSQYIIPSGSITITENGTTDVTSKAEVIVSVTAGAPTTQSKTIIPTESIQIVTPDSGKYLSLVTVEAINSNYIGTNIPLKNSTDLTISENVITVPAGYYATQAIASVSLMTLPTTIATASTTGYTLKATANRSTTNQFINIPVGYNSIGAYYKINSVPNGTVTAPTTITSTNATVTTGTNTLTFSKVVSITPNVTTSGYISAGTAGNTTVSLTATISTKAATTYYPSTADQTITANQYLTGIQTFKSIIVSGLSANKILSGTTIKIGDAVDDDRIMSINGTVVFQTIYSGSSAPSSGTGINGDIYIQTS